MILKLFQAGEPVLRQRARPLTPDEVRGARVQDLIAAMRETLRDAPGVGLAAPQVGESLQLALIEDRAEYQQGLRPEDRAARERAPVPLQVLVNPTLTPVTEEGDAAFFEGCLSLTGFVAMVKRARVVRVDALDAHGEPLTFVARGWHARIVQHEVDHLNGTLYLDRAATRSFMASSQYERLWSGVSPDEIRERLDLDRAP